MSDWNAILVSYAHNTAELGGIVAILGVAIWCGFMAFRFSQKESSSLWGFAGALAVIAAVVAGLLLKPNFLQGLIGLVVVFLILLGVFGQLLMPALKRRRRRY